MTVLHILVLPLLMGVDRETRFLMLLEYKDEFNKNNDRGLMLRKCQE
jgi:hypothetical protein